MGNVNMTAEVLFGYAEQISVSLSFPSLSNSRSLRLEDKLCIRCYTSPCQSVHLVRPCFLVRHHVLLLLQHPQVLTHFTELV